MKALADCRLYAFVDTAYLHGRKPVEIAHQLCDGGADLIQLRAKQSAPDEIRRLAEIILPITRAAGVGLVINDHPEIARALGADLCHLGQEDFFEAGHKHVNEVRLESRGMRIGLSTHAPAQAERARAAGADYIAIGPVFATPTKPGRPGVTLDYVRWAATHLHVPWFAIGGITLQNLDGVLAAGARRICVVSAILNASDVTVACRQFKERLLSAR
ncbi:MAG: thiamine phosphate synthase [Pedosphaera sp.]|nr:thiamine phosphate synthase [Pedosphaera sp.]